MDRPQWPPGSTSPPLQSVSPAALSNSPASTSPTPAQPSTMASYPSSYAFPNPRFANSYQQQAAGRPTPMAVMSQPQSNNAGYLAPSAPHTQTPAMGYPTLRYNSLQADNDRIGAVNNVALPAQQQNQQFQRFQAFQQQQLQQFLLWQKKQFATALQQQTPQRQQQQQFPQPNLQQQQQYLQSQTPAAFPNQNVPQIYCNNSNGQNSQSNQNNQVSQSNQVSENNQVSNNSNQVGHNNQVSNNNKHVSFNNQAGNSNNQVSYTSNQASHGNHQASYSNNQASIPALIAKLDVSLNSGDLPPIPPLVEPHPLTKNFEDLRVLLHPIPTHVIERLSMTTASSLMRLCLDFEYRDLSADYPIALQLETKAWLMRYLRDLNAARRTSGIRLCRHWHKRLYQHTRVNPQTGLYEYVPDEVEVAGGTEKELKMLDYEAREELGSAQGLFEEIKKVLIPLIHPDWKFLQLRQNRGPSAKEWEDVVVDDVGELRRLKENTEREHREQVDAWNNQAHGNGEVAIVGSRMLSDEEMRMAAQQRAWFAQQNAGFAVGLLPKHKRKPSKNIAAGSSTPKKSPVKPKGQRKQNGRKKSLVAAKDKVTSQSSTPEADSLQRTAPIPDYPDDYGTGNMAAQRDKYSQMPVAATGASVVASHNNAATAALPSNNASAQPTPQLPDYPDIYGPAIQTTNQNSATAAGPNTFTPGVTTTAPATAVPDYPPIYTAENTNQHNAAAAGGPNTSAVTTTSASAPSDYPPMYATGSTAGTASISPSIQPAAASEADTAPAADPLPQVDGGFGPEDDGLDDLFEGELDE